jgi:hypothetical protein
MLVVVMHAVSIQAAAQDRSASGGANAAPLSLSLASYAGHDEAAIEQRVGAANSERVSDGTHAGLTAAIAYRPKFSKMVFNFSAGSDVQRLTGSRLSGVTGHTSFGDVSLGRSVGRRGSVLVTQRASTSSFYQFNPTTGTAIRSLDDFERPTSDYRLERGQTRHYEVSVMAKRQLGRRAELHADAGYRRSQFPGEEIDHNSRYTNVRLSHPIGRSLVFHWGYGLEYGVSGTTRPSRVHRFDVGPRYAKTITIARRTYINGSVGGALVSVETAEGIRTVPRVVGNLAAQRYFRRTWSVAAGWHSEPQMVDLYANPVYTHSAFVALRGAVNRRLALATTGGISRASLDAGRGAMANNTMFGSLRGQISATRTLAVFAEYSYYGFHGATAPVSASRFALQARRHSLRTGLSVRIPLLSTEP